MDIKLAKKENLKQIINILEQISRMHYENRPDIFKDKNKNQIEKDTIEILNDKNKTVLIATDSSSIVYGVLIYKVKEVKNHINLKDT